MHFVLNWTSKGNIICEHSRTVQENWLMLFSIVYQKLRKHVSWFRRKFKKLSIFGFSYGCNGERYIKIFRRKKRYKVILGLNLFFRSHILFKEKNAAIFDWLSAITILRDWVSEMEIDCPFFYMIYFSKTSTTEKGMMLFIQ